MSITEARNLIGRQLRAGLLTREEASTCHRLLSDLSRGSQFGAAVSSKTRRRRAAIIAGAE